MSLLDREPFASFFGRGKASITVPVLDGAFRPNDVIEKADLLADLPGCDTVVADGNRILVAAGREIFDLSSGRAVPVIALDDRISAFAASNGIMAAGLENGGINIIGKDAAPIAIKEACGAPIRCATAMLIVDDKLIVAEGSATNPPGEWSRDLLERNSTGRVFEFEIGSGKTRFIANNVAYANGLARDANGGIVVSQSWFHCLSPVDRLDRRQAVLGGLAGYPSRLSPASDGGYWLAIFGMRTQLIEFVLREDSYRKKMLETVPAEYWVAPSLMARENFLDPLQQGGAKQLGIKKPWAPPRSYGLLAKLDRNFNPQFSFHSRVGGTRHGITSVAEAGGRLYIVSKGRGEVLMLDIAAMTEGLVQ